MDDQITDRDCGGMRFRKLRIAWSVGCGSLCVLLMALWVRSYWQTDMVTFPISSSRALGAQSYWASASLVILDSSYWVDSHNFRFEVSAADGGSSWKQVHTVFGGFAMTPAPNSCVITTPDWFLILLATALGGVPWLPWWSKRFSLRTLLITTTLVAVWLGFVVYMARR
jgi:hypothetical protein